MTPQEAEKLTCDRKTLYDAALKQAEDSIKSDYILGHSFSFYLVWVEEVVSMKDFPEITEDDMHMSDFCDNCRHAMHKAHDVGRGRFKTIPNEARCERHA